MGEHALRYERPAVFLSEAGFHVYASDHRGHGRTAKSRQALGDFGGGGWEALVEDQVVLTKTAQSRDRGLPLVLLGHSMGSFAAQQYVLDHSHLLAALVLSGSVSVDKLEIDTSREVDLSSFNQGIERPRTSFDWLSRDAAEVDAYIADPLCGFGVNKESLKTMADSSSRLSEPSEIACIRRDLPIYILAGDQDPINHNLEWLKPVAQRYRVAGIADVTERYYSGGRHEMLNETNRQEVMNDLLAWLRRVVSKAP
jgi:alpha-beta hydrolase superfamily lysophospholipase